MVNDLSGERCKIHNGNSNIRRFNSNTCSRHSTCIGSKNDRNRSDRKQDLVYHWSNTGSNRNPIPDLWIDRHDSLT